MLQLKQPCSFCGQPIVEGESFACFKNYSTHTYQFFHRRPFKNDCWSQFLIQHLLEIKTPCELKEWEVT